MTKREAFLQAVSNDTIKDFLQFIQLHKDHSDPFDLNELLQELSKKQKEELWMRLQKLLTVVLLENPVEGWQQTVDEDPDDEMEVENSPDMVQTIDVIKGVTNVVTASVAVVDEAVVYTTLLECAIILNGIVPVLPKSEIALKISIRHLCEVWWGKGLEGKEELGKTALIMLIERSLLAKNSGADIVRLWNLHQALLNFEYDSEESNEVKDLLLQCFMSISHIKKEEGRRFLSFLFSWNVNFIKMIHGTIKNQLQFFPKSLMAYIAEIYFRAWKKAPGEFLETIESICIQDFMHYGVHLPRRSPVHSKVRQARNSEVRANAALLFVEAFPIRDPSLDNEGMDNEIQKQFEELFSLLEDPQPLVRSTGVLGVCRIASRYWDMIPPIILTDLLQKILNDLASDVSSAEVRCSVFKCLPIILDNKLSHPLLEQLLPALKNSLHDNSEKVRVAFIDMLLKIKAVRAAKFWKTCPMDHILARLEMDSRPVAKRIVNLLFNSFFPVNQPEEVWCERCVTLIQMNPMAARKFYQYAYEYTAPANIAKLMLTIRRCLNACIQRSVREHQAEGGGDDDDNEEENDKENTSVLDSVLSTTDVATMASLLEIIVILWRNIHKALDQNEEAKTYTISKFASVLPEYFKVFKEDRCMVPLIILASFMPASAVPTFSCGVLSKLRNLENEADENKYSTLIDCLCQWGQVGHILELITDWLTDELPHKKNTKDSKPRVRIQETVESKPGLALDYMEYLLTHTMNRNCLLAVPQKKLHQLLKALGAVKEELYSLIRTSEAKPHIDKTTALRAFGLYCRLSIHLQHRYHAEGRSYLTVLENTAVWIGDNILTFLQTPENEEEVSLQQSDTAKQVIEAFLTVCKDILMVGLADPEFQAQLLDFELAVLQTERGFLCLPLLVTVLKEIAETCLAKNIDGTNEEFAPILGDVQQAFQKIMETVARRLKKQQEETVQMLHLVQAALGEFITTIQCWQASCEAVHRGMLSTLLAAVVVELSHSLQKSSNLEEFTPPETLTDLPPLSSCLLTIIFKSANVSRSFLNELMECIDSEAIEGVVGITAAVHVLWIYRGRHKGSWIKDSVSTILRKLKTHNEITLEDTGNLERVLYESSVKLLDDLLRPSV
nr:PREDICTED: condensin-2 complex subunit G2 isoform X2 [Latimeria chalumnae]|eukprot:XP_014351166.1 PREDICTED: condensin-2 complex subunit G2 isoform X2 [Latimeria chalumnae]